jgi:hypothetical protein
VQEIEFFKFFLRLLALRLKSDGLKLTSILEEKPVCCGTLNMGNFLSLDNLFMHGYMTRHPSVVHFAVISQWKTLQQVRLFLQAS